MELGTLLVLLLVVACPLLMVWMMRGHGGHGQASPGPGDAHLHAGGSEVPGGGSLGELRQRRAALNAEIAQLEEAEAEMKTPAAV